jgi:hypothetical protein
MVDVSIMHDHRPVSRTRCGILHAAPQSRSASKTRVNALMALRCVRGTRPLTAIQRGGHPLRNIAFREEAECRALQSGRLALALRNGDQKVATS